MKRRFTSSWKLPIVAIIAMTAGLAALLVANQAIAQVPILTISPTSGPPGQTVTVTASPPTPFGLHWSDPYCSSSSFVAVGVTRATFAVPAGTAPGTYWIYAVLDSVGFENECQPIGKFTVTAPPTATPTKTPTPVQPTPDLKPPPVQPPLVPVLPQNRLPGCPEYANPIPSTRTSKTLVVIVHGWKSKPSDLDGLRNAYTTKGANADVVSLDWSSGSAASHPGTGGYEDGNAVSFLRGPFPRLNEASRVGKCLGDALMFSGYDSFHLIAHSLGSWVIDRAAGQLATIPSKRVHLTFLDAYVPNYGDRGELGDQAFFAEQYVSRLLGSPTKTDRLLPEAYNWDVTDESQLPPSIRSQWLNLGVPAIGAGLPEPVQSVARQLAVQEGSALADAYFKTGENEHGWPITEYTRLVSDGKVLGWEWNRPPSHDQYPESPGANVYCLTKSLPGACAEEVPVFSTKTLKTSDVKVAPLKGCQVAGGRLDCKTESPASARIEFSERAAAMTLDLSASFVGTGNGTLTVRVNGTREFRIQFGTEGLPDGVALLLAEETTVTSVEIVFDTIGAGQVTAELKGLTMIVASQQTAGTRGAGAGSSAGTGPVQVTPRPPATGSGGGSDARGLSATSVIVLATLAVAATGGTLATRRRIRVK